MSESRAAPGPTSRPLLVLHGALGSGAQMAPIASALGATATMVVEWPGHGRTPLAEDASFAMPRFADHLAQALAAHGGPPPSVFGYSMGGYVALALEARAPGSFASIVTLGTKFAWSPESAARETLRLDPVAIATKVPKFAAMLAERHGADRWEALLARTARLMRAEGNAPTLTTEALARVRCPVRLAVGTRDETVTIAETMAAARAMPNAEVEVLDDVPHPIERVPVATIVELMRGMGAA